VYFGTINKERIYAVILQHNGFRQHSFNSDYSLIPFLKRVSDISEIIERFFGNNFNKQRLVNWRSEMSKSWEENLTMVKIKIVIKYPLIIILCEKLLLKK
jgi:hypothetical protein